jgi:hypothetical protein
MKSNYSGKDDGFNLVWREGALYPTENTRIEKKGKGLGKYAQAALDALEGMGGATPVSAGRWRDRFLELYLEQYGSTPTSVSGTWRDLKKQLFSRGIVDGSEGQVWLVKP